MVITGKVISKAVNVMVPKAQGGGSYPAWTLSYITANNEKRDVTKHMNSLKWGNGPAIRAALDQLEGGDSFYMELEKKGEFNEVVNLAKGEPSVELAQSAQTSQTTRSTGKVLGSTYETPEERALRREAEKIKQRLIVRQSSFDQAREISPKAKVEDIFATAEQIENWVYRGME